jgi:hypothetical protein
LLVASLKANVALLALAFCSTAALGAGAALFEFFGAGTALFAITVLLVVDDGMTFLGVAVFVLVLPAATNAGFTDAALDAGDPAFVTSPTGFGNPERNAANGDITTGLLGVLDELDSVFRSGLTAGRTNTRVSRLGPVGFVLAGGIVGFGLDAEAAVGAAIFEVGFVVVAGERGEGEKRVEREKTSELAAVAALFKTPSADDLDLKAEDTGLEGAFGLADAAEVFVTLFEALGENCNKALSRSNMGLAAAEGAPTRVVLGREASWGSNSVCYGEHQTLRGMFFDTTCV